MCNGSDIFWDTSQVEQYPNEGLSDWHNIQGYPDIIWHVKHVIASDSDIWVFKNYLEWFGHFCNVSQIE